MRVSDLMKEAEAYSVACSHSYEWVQLEENRFSPPRNFHLSDSDYQRVYALEQSVERNFNNSPALFWFLYNHPHKPWLDVPITVENMSYRPQNGEQPLYIGQIQCYFSFSASHNRRPGSESSRSKLERFVITCSTEELEEISKALKKINQGR